MCPEVSPGESVAVAAGRAGSVVQGPCRGHGRCGMCVVTVLDGMDSLCAAGEAEARVLRILGAKPDQRLACQARLSPPPQSRKARPDQR